MLFEDCYLKLEEDSVLEMLENNSDCAPILVELHEVTRKETVSCLKTCPDIEKTYCETSSVIYAVTVYYNQDISATLTLFDSKEAEENFYKIIESKIQAKH